MDRNYIIFIFWLGFIAYLLVALLYINYIRLDFIEGKFTSGFYFKFIIAIAFLLLSTHSIQAAITASTSHSEKATDIIHTDSLTHFPADIGFGLLALYFCLIFNKSNHFFYVLAPIGNMFLATNNQIGLYLITLFYIISLGYHILDFANTDYYVMTTKILLLVYYCTYIYANIQKNIENGNKNILLV